MAKRAKKAAGKASVQATAPKRDHRHPRKSTVYVVVRHTRSGDVRQGVIDSEQYAMEMAERVADEAARAYGEGSASVFKATLTLHGDAIKPA
jgi:hypothetical protein